MRRPEPEEGRAGARLVVALMGLPGAGKSTVARHLLAELPLHLVDRDAIRAALFPRCAYTPAEKVAANAAVLEAVATNCRLGRASLVDGMTFARAADLRALRERVEGSGHALLTLFLECEPATAASRIAAQQRSGTHIAADRTPDLVTAVAARFDAPPPDAHRIDAQRPLEEVCATALAVVSPALGAVRPTSC